MTNTTLGVPWECPCGAIASSMQPRCPFCQIPFRDEYLRARPADARREQRLAHLRRIGAGPPAGEPAILRELEELITAGLLAEVDRFEANQVRSEAKAANSGEADEGRASVGEVPDSPHS